MSAPVDTQPPGNRSGLTQRQSIRNGWLHLKWPLIGTLWVATLALGCVGFARLPAPAGQPRSLLDLLYLSIQLFVLQSGAIDGLKSWQLEVARFLAPTLAGYTAIQALATIFSDQLLSLRLTFIRDHFVICGLGGKGYLLAKGFRERGDRVVVIERNEDERQIELCRDHGIAVLVGDATDPSLLRRARVSEAQAVLALFGDDGDNADVAVHARDMAANLRGRSLTCVVHIVDPKLYTLFRQQELPAEQAGSFRQEFFNVYDQGARILLKRFPAFPEESGRRPRPLVIGLGRMGQSLVVRMARSWRARFEATGERLRVTILDRNAERKVESLLLQYPQLGQVCDLVPLSMDIRSPEFEKAAFLFREDGACAVTIAYICLDDDSFALYAALALRQRTRGPQFPIVVRMAQNAGLAALLQGSPAGRFEGLFAFGLLDETCTPDLVLGGTHESLARAIHEDYLRLEVESGRAPDTSPSAVVWDRLPAATKESNRRQADHIAAKLKAIGCGIAPLTDWNAESFPFTAAEVETMARMEYERYRAERRLEIRRGRPARAVADFPEVAWPDVPEAEKEKDRSFVRCIPALLAQAGFQVYRLPAFSAGLRP